MSPKLLPICIRISQRAYASERFVGFSRNFLEISEMLQISVMRPEKFQEKLGGNVFIKKAIRHFGG
jgi:hypothetical protein